MIQDLEETFESLRRVNLRLNPEKCMFRVPSGKLLGFLVVGILGMGVPRLACLRPAVWLKGGPSTARLHQHKPKTLARGQASQGVRHKASSGAASPGRLMRRRRDQGRVPREVLVTQAMTIETRRALARTVSLFPLWC